MAMTAVMSCRTRALRVGVRPKGIEDRRGRGGAHRTGEMRWRELNIR
jgi:hypothetical protein